MNLALVYRGFYKRDGIKKNSFSLDIFKNHLHSINSLGVNNIDIYFHTYSFNDYEDNNFLSIFESYNVKKYNIEKEIQLKISYSIINSLELLENKKYDLIINTRFDIYFIRPLNELNINNKKINLLFKEQYKFWNKDKRVSDLIYILPSEYKNVLISALKKSQHLNKNGSGHKIYNYLKVDTNNINFMIDGFFNSNTDKEPNNYIYIKRD